MTTEVHMERFEEARKAVMVMLKAGQAMRAFGKVAMPESLDADEQLTGVNRSEVASVLDFFGEVIDQNAAAAYEFIFRVDDSMVAALMNAGGSDAMQGGA